MVVMIVTVCDVILYLAEEQNFTSLWILVSLISSTLLVIIGLLIAIIILGKFILVSCVLN